MWRDLLPHVVSAFGLGGGVSVYGLVRSIAYFLTWKNALYGDEERSRRAMRPLTLLKTAAA